MDKGLLSFLICTKCKKGALHRQQTSLWCTSCAATYPVQQDIPVLVDRLRLPRHLLDQIKYFQAETKGYPTRYTIEPWQKHYIDRFIKALGSCRGKVIIDDACGSGYITIEAAKRGATVIACDLNMSALVRLAAVSRQMKLAGRIIPVCCSSESLPVKRSVADGLAANAILEHLPNEKNAIRDIMRVVKRGGVAMVTVPLAYHLLNPLFLLLNYVYDKNIGHLRRYTREMLMKRFSGWKLLKTYYTGHTRKVIKTLINRIRPTFSANEIEKEDEKYIDRKIFASNICVIFQKT